jgi:hypothetical protein
MKIDRPRTSPGDYIKFGGNQDKKLKFKDQYDLKAAVQETPWITSRFGPQDLTKRVANRRLNLNELNFVPEGELQDGYEMFPGRGRFNMETDYDFTIGRPSTPNYPEQQPDFDPEWNNSYGLSPVIPPGEKIKNPFPRQDNIDPNGYLSAMLAEGTNTDIPKFPNLINENPQASLSI